MSFFQRCPALTDQDLDFLAENFSTHVLRSLVVTSAPHISDASCQRLLLAMPYLRRMSFQRVPQLSPQFMESIWLRKTFVSFSIDSNLVSTIRPINVSTIKLKKTVLTNDVIGSIMENVEFPISLLLCECNLSSDFSIKFRKVHRLIFKNMPEISFENLVSFMQGATDLQHLYQLDPTAEVQISDHIKMFLMDNSEVKSAHLGHLFHFYPSDGFTLHTYANFASYNPTIKSLGEKEGDLPSVHFSGNTTKFLGMRIRFPSGAPFSADADQISITYRMPTYQMSSQASFDVIYNGQTFYRVTMQTSKMAIACPYKFDVILGGGKNISFSLQRSQIVSRCTFKILGHEFRVEYTDSTKMLLIQVPPKVNFVFYLPLMFLACQAAYIVRL